MSIPSTRSRAPTKQQSSSSTLAFQTQKLHLDKAKGCFNSVSLVLWLLGNVFFLYHLLSWFQVSFVTRCSFLVNIYLSLPRSTFPLSERPLQSSYILPFTSCIYPNSLTKLALFNNTALSPTTFNRYISGVLNSLLFIYHAFREPSRYSTYQLVQISGKRKPVE